MKKRANLKKPFDNVYIIDNIAQVIFINYEQVIFFFTLNW